MSTNPAQRTPGDPAIYWSIVGVLIVLGALSILSIGIGLALVGITLAGLFPFRTNRLVFWPGLAAPFGFILGWMVSAPSRCVDVVISRTETSISTTSSCQAFLPISYGTPPFNYFPALVGALIGAVVIGLWTFLVVRLLVSRGAVAR